MLINGPETSKIAPFRGGDLDPIYSLHGFLGPPESSPNSILIGSAVFAGLTHNQHTDTQTDTQTTLLRL